MTSTRLAISRRGRHSPKALTSAVMFFLASGRLMARMTGLRGLERKRKISFQMGGSSRFSLKPMGADAGGAGAPWGLVAGDWARLLLLPR